MVVTEELVERMIAIEIANLESRLACYAARPGNPSGVHIRRFGRATAFAAGRIPVRFFNSVLGVGPEIVDHLDAIRAFYQQHGGEGALEIVPGRLNEPLGFELARRGYAMAEFHAGLARPIGPTDRDAPEPPGVEIEELSREDRPGFDRFLGVYLEGWGADPSSADDAKANMDGWRDIDAWRFYLASVEGEPSGAAILDRRGATAMLGSASTRPSKRGKSVQLALLNRRLRDAARAGCDLIVGGAYFGTSSMRNQQRAGFSTAFTRGIWVPRRVAS